MFLLEELQALEGPKIHLAQFSYKFCDNISLKMHPLYGEC